MQKLMTVFLNKITIKAAYGRILLSRTKLHTIVVVEVPPFALWFLTVISR